MSKVVNIDIDRINELINKLNIMVENTEPEVVAEPATKNNKRGRKPKYASDEERHQAAILQFEDMRKQINELTAIL